MLTNTGLQEWKKFADKTCKIVSASTINICVSQTEQDVVKEIMMALANRYAYREGRAHIRSFTSGFKYDRGYAGLDDWLDKKELRND
jgi:hypothetical protein